MLSILRATAVAFAGLALMPALARAHSTADPGEGTAGGYLRTAFRVTHGCKGSPTTAATIRIPEGVTIEIETRRAESATFSVPFTFAMR